MKCNLSHFFCLQEKWWKVYKEIIPDFLAVYQRDKLNRNIRPGKSFHWDALAFLYVSLLLLINTRREKKRFN